MKLLYITILSLLILSGCAGEDPNEHTTDSGIESSSNSTDDNSEDALEEEVNEALEGLSLNDGSKWKVDQSTDEGMKSIREKVENFDGEDAEQLGKDIKSVLKDITKDCSMTGEDHNQYHILLDAMMKESKQLKKGKSTDPSKMERYLDAYDTYFEVGELE